MRRSNDPANIYAVGKGMGKTAASFNLEKNVSYSSFSNYVVNMPLRPQESDRATM